MQLQEVLWPSKYLLDPVGLWPMHPNPTRSQRYLFYFRFVSAMFTQITLVVPHIATVVMNWGEIEILRDCGSLTIVFVLGTLKMLYFAFRQRKYLSMHQYIKDFWNISDDPKERANYEHFANLAKVLVIMSAMAGISDLIGFDGVALITTINNGQGESNDSLSYRLLPFNVTYGFNAQNSTPIYHILFIWQSVCIVHCVCVVVGGDTMLMVFIYHLAGQFKLINYRFREIGRKINETPISKDANREFRDDIGKCIAQHQRIIRITKEFDAFMSPVIFCQIMTSGLVICLSCYAVIQGRTSTGNLIKFLVFFVSMLMQLICWCWPAEVLISESRKIAKTIYHDIPWFRLTLKQQRDLNIVVLRAQKECHLTALFQVMSIEKFTEVFNAAIAYMTVLRRMEN